MRRRVEFMDSINRFKGKNSFLSNFYPVFVYYNGIRFPSVEHAFQAAKSLDIEEQKLFAITPSAAEAKKWGKSVKLRPDWENVKVDIMEILLRQKFSYPELKSKLLETGNVTLVEGNTHGDKFWGVVGNEGQNILGRLLMKIREEMR